MFFYDGRGRPRPRAIVCEESCGGKWTSVRDRVHHVLSAAGTQPTAGSIRCWRDSAPKRVNILEHGQGLWTEYRLSEEETKRLLQLVHIQVNLELRLAAAELCEETGKGVAVDDGEEEWIKELAWWMPACGLQKASISNSSEHK